MIWGNKYRRTAVLSRLALKAAVSYQQQNSCDAIRRIHQKNTKTIDILTAIRVISVKLREKNYLTIGMKHLAEMNRDYHHVMLRTMS